MSETIKSIDENSKKIVFKHFDDQHVNIAAKKSPSILQNLKDISRKIKNQKPNT